MHLHPSLHGWNLESIAGIVSSYPKVQLVVYAHDYYLCCTNYNLYRIVLNYADLLDWATHNARDVPITLTALFVKIASGGFCTTSFIA